MRQVFFNSNSSVNLNCSACVARRIAQIETGVDRAPSLICNNSRLILYSLVHLRTIQRDAKVAQFSTCQGRSHRALSRIMRSLQRIHSRLIQTIKNRRLTRRRRSRLNCRSDSKSVESIRKSSKVSHRSSNRIPAYLLARHHQLCHLTQWRLQILWQLKTCNAWKTTRLA